MSKFHTIIKMQPNEGAAIEFNSGEHETLAEAFEAQIPLIANHFNKDAAWAGDFLADMEIHGKLEELSYKDGVLIDAGEYL